MGTAAWNTNSLMGVVLVLVALSEMVTTVGWLGLRSKLKSTFNPFFSNATIDGMAAVGKDKVNNFNIH